MNHKRGRPSNYRKHMKNNPYWERVKRKCNIRDGFKCVICGAKTKLERHHITYRIGGVSIVGMELAYLKWLVTLCEDCHTDAHFLPGHPFNPKNPNKMNVDQYLKSR